jgi:hypothetical protein
VKLFFVGLFPDPKLPTPIQEAIERLWKIEATGSGRCVCGAIDVINSDSPPIWVRMHRSCPVYAGFYALLSEYEVDPDELSLTQVEVDADPEFIKGCFVADTEEEIEALQNSFGLTSEGIDKDWYREALRKSSHDEEV